MLRIAVQIILILAMWYIKEQHDLKYDRIRRIVQECDEAEILECNDTRLSIL